MTDTPPEEVNPPAEVEPVPEEPAVPDPTETPSGDTSSDSAVITVEPESAESTDSEVTPAASEAPDPADTTPAEPTAPLLPADGNWSPEQIVAAEAAGVDTPAGAALSAAAVQILRGLDEAIAGIESWIGHAKATLAKLPPR